MWAVEDADTGVTEAWVRRFKTNMELKGRGLMFIELFVPQIKKKKFQPVMFIYNSGRTSYWMFHV